MIMSIVSLKDLLDLFCMGLAECGGKARRVEVQRWIGDYTEQMGMKFTTHDYLDSQWQYKCGWVIQELQKQNVIVQTPGPSNTTLWTFSN